jgi:hypothetical protein
LKGWKTWTGAVMVAIGGILQGMPELFPGQTSLATFLLSIGAALGGIGIAHKIEKAASK